MRIAFIVAMLAACSCVGMCSMVHPNARAGQTSIGVSFRAAAEAQDDNSYEASLPNPCVETPPPGSPVNFYAARCELDFAHSANVDTWTDEGSAGSDLTAAGAAQPVYLDPCDTLADGGSLINGEPCVAFDGTADVMTSLSAGGTETWTVCYFLRSVETVASYALGQATGGNPHQLLIAAQATNDAFRFQGKDSAAWRNLDMNAKYVPDRFSYGCYKFFGGTTAPRHCTDETNPVNCGQTTQPSVSYSIDNWTYVALGANFTTYGQVDWIELGYWEEDVSTADWKTYLESVYGTLPSDS